MRLHLLRNPIYSLGQRGTQQRRGQDHGTRRYGRGRNRNRDRPSLWRARCFLTHSAATATHVSTAPKSTAPSGTVARAPCWTCMPRPATMVGDGSGAVALCETKVSHCIHLLRANPPGCHGEMGPGSGLRLASKADAHQGTAGVPLLVLLLSKHVFSV